MRLLKPQDLAEQQSEDEGLAIEKSLEKTLHLKKVSYFSITILACLFRT